MSDSPIEPDLARLRAIAEDPVARPSERVDARRRLVELGAVPPGRLVGRERQDALAVARAMLREDKVDHAYVIGPLDASNIGVRFSIYGR